ncbi:hypothetical protein CDV49_00485 [Haematobacter genomosp. 1]|uniref:Uncharacterized protein n=1 Tax=Haematobacter genomosp. 1 TaxID=366618 RepID=A0A212AGS8_9RHOB|nr:hypothetical protein CDV49_00485 [Haematobacter genomosp. 1]
MSCVVWPAEYGLLRHSGIQAFRHSGIQAFRHSGIQAFRHSGIQAFRHSGIQADIRWPRRIGIRQRSATCRARCLVSDEPPLAFGRSAGGRRAGLPPLSEKSQDDPRHAPAAE